MSIYTEKVYGGYRSKLFRCDMCNKEYPAPPENCEVDGLLKLHFGKYIGKVKYICSGHKNSEIELLIIQSGEDTGFDKNEKEDRSIIIHNHGESSGVGPPW